MKSLIIIAGPTAVGKTNTAIKIAEKYKTEILSADSRQFYKELKIGTATPEEEELKRVKHHFIGNLSIHDDYNVSKYEREALSVINDLFLKKDFVVVTGGSGLYLDVLTGGIDELPDIEPSLRIRLQDEFENNGLSWLQKEVEKVDPEYYSTADKKNPKRLIRALEIYYSTGEKFSNLRREVKKNRPFGIIKIGLYREREELNERINSRTDKMIAAGFFDECLELYDYRELNALKSVGYTEMFKVISREWDLEYAVEKMKTNTRRYAKRQMTWFKRDKNIKWFHPDDIPEIVEYINSRV